MNSMKTEDDELYRSNHGNWQKRGRILGNIILKAGFSKLFALRLIIIINDPLLLLLVLGFSFIEFIESLNGRYACFNIIL